LQAEKEVTNSNHGGLQETQEISGEHQLALGACDEVWQVHSWLQDYS